MDITWDFTANDVGLLNGDFFINTSPSMQNATLIVLKSAVNVLNPAFGVGFENTYANSGFAAASQLVGEAKQQILDDGATTCAILLTPLGNGSYDLSIEAKYPTT